jgi:hypothetical protein
MPLKGIFLTVGFLISWFVLLPVLVIGGGMALLAGATLAEVGSSLIGGSSQGSKGQNVRDIARRMVAGYARH